MIITRRRWSKSSGFEHLFAGTKWSRSTWSLRVTRVFPRVEPTSRVTRKVKVKKSHIYREIDVILSGYHHKNVYGTSPNRTQYRTTSWDRKRRHCSAQHRNLLPETSTLGQATNLLIAANFAVERACVSSNFGVDGPLDVTGVLVLKFDGSRAKEMRAEGVTVGMRPGTTLALLCALVAGVTQVR